jgi:hypothetical protein
VQSIVWSPFIGGCTISYRIGVVSTDASRDRNRWSLFPVVFGDRRLPLDAYDELMGTLLHGCVGEPIFP